MCDPKDNGNVCWAISVMYLLIGEVIYTWHTVDTFVCYSADTNVEYIHSQVTFYSLSPE